MPIDELNPQRIDSAVMRGIVFHDHADVRRAFYQALAPEIDAAIDWLAKAYNAFQQLQGNVALNERSATVQMFLHAAHNSVISAVHLLISGFLAPAGNQMRQFGEATAMALLCAEPTNGTFESYDQLGVRYPFHKAIARAGRSDVRKKLRLSAEGWQAFQRTTEAYDRFSHASTFSLAGHIMFDQPGKVLLAGDFDPAKREIYAAELRRMRVAAGSLLDAIRLVAEHSSSQA